MENTQEGPKPKNKQSAAERYLSKDSIAFNPELRAMEEKYNEKSRTTVLGEDTGLPNVTTRLEYRKLPFRDTNEYNRLLTKPWEYNGTADDINGRLGDNQWGLSQLAVGLGRMPFIVGTKILSSVNGIKNFVKEAAGGFEGQAYVDDPIGKSITEAENYFKEKWMPIYGETGSQDKGLAGQFFTTKFWADEVLDGAAYAAAAALITRGTGAIGGALGRATGIAGEAGAVAAEGAALTANATKYSSLLASGAKSLGWGAYGAMQEAAVEASGQAESIKQQLEGKPNPNTGLIYTDEEIRGIQAEAASKTFTSNFFALMPSAMWEARIVLGLGKKTAAKGLSNTLRTGIKNGTVSAAEIMEGLGADKLRKGATKAFLKKAGEGILVEGLWEENVQTAIQNYDADNAINGKHPAFDKRGLEYLTGMYENLGTTEGQKAIALGAIIGSGMGGFSGVQNASIQNKAMEGFIQSLSAANSTLINNTKSYLKVHPEDVTDAAGTIVATKGSIMLDENGKPQIDEDAALTLTHQVLATKRLADKHAMGIVQGQDELLKLNADITMASSIWTAMHNKGFEDANDAVDFLKFHHEQIIKEQAEQRDDAIEQGVEEGTQLTEDELEKKRQEAKATSALKKANAVDQAEVSKMINAHKATIDNLSKAFQEVQDKSSDLNKVDQSPERSSFNEIIKKGMFYERAKQGALKEIITDRQRSLAEASRDRIAPDQKTRTEEKIEKEIEGLEGNLRDSMEKYNKYYEEPDAVYAAWKSPQTEYEAKYKEHKEIVEKLKDFKEEDKQGDEYKTLFRRNQQLAYEMNEATRKEGPAFVDKQTQRVMQLQRENIISTEQYRRVQQKAGLRYKYYEDAARGVQALSRIDDSIKAANRDTEKAIAELEGLGLTAENATPEQLDSVDITGLVTNLVNVVTANIKILDDDIIDDVNDMLDNRERIVSTIQDIIDTIDLAVIDPTAYSEENFLTVEKLEGMKNVVSKDVIQARLDLNKAINESQRKQDLFSPEKIEDHLTEEIAREYLATGEHILSIGYNLDGSPNEDFTDVSGTKGALSKAILMRNVIEERYNSGDLQNKQQFKDLVDEADTLIAKLATLLILAQANQNNREAKQREINQKEAMKKFDMLQKENSAIFKVLNAAFGGKLNEHLEDAMELLDVLNEAVGAVLSYGVSLSDKAVLDTAIEEEKAKAFLKLVSLHYTLTDEARNALRDNPEQMFGILLEATQNIFNLNRIDTSKNSLIGRFKRNNDIYELLERIEALPEDSDQLLAPKEEYLKLINAYKDLVELAKLKNLANSNINEVMATASKLESLVDDGAFAPTSQQEIALRELSAWVADETTTDTNWAYLRGIAGTGKTNVVIKWLLKLNKTLTPSEIITTAGIQPAAEVLASVTGSPAIPFDDVMAMDLTGKRFVFIDEYGTLDREKLVAFRDKIKDHNQAVRDNTPAGEKPATVKVVILGDPTQISPRVNDQTDINYYDRFNTESANTTVIAPLTVVYRSDVSAINEVSDIFQAETAPVSSISARSNKAVGEAGAMGIQVTTNKESLINSIKANLADPLAKSRSRVILVEDQAAIQAYTAELAANGIAPDAVQVITVYDAQSKTFDEVYVDLPISNDQATPTRPLTPTKQKENAKSNTKMYTAISRAKEFSMVIYPDSKNVLDDSLNNEKETNAAQVKEAKQEYYLKKAKEEQIFKNLREKKPLEEGLEDLEKKAKPAPAKATTVTDEENDEDGEATVETDEADTASAAETEEEFEEDVEEDIDDEHSKDAEGRETEPSTVIESVDTDVEEVVPNLTTDAYNGLFVDPVTGKPAIQKGNKVYYVHGTRKWNGTDQSTLHIVMETADGKLLQIGQLFEGEIESELRKQLFTKTQMTEAQFKKAMSGNKANAFNKAGAIVKEGKIRQTQKMAFNYSFASEALKQNVFQYILNNIKNLFKGKPRVTYHIFSLGSAEKAGLVKLNGGEYVAEGSRLPLNMIGRPIAVLRPEETDYDKNGNPKPTEDNDFSQAKFVPLQAGNLREDSEDVTILRDFTKAVRAIEEIASRKFGGKPSAVFMKNSQFSHSVRAMKGALDVEETQVVGGGANKSMRTDVKLIRSAEPFTYDDYVAAYRELHGKETKTNPETVQVPLSEEEFDEAKEPLMQVAMGYYGYGKVKVKELNEDGLEVEVEKNGVVANAGYAQKAFNRIARANQFAGTTRIRERVIIGKNAKGKPVYRNTGKSLLSTINSNSSSLYPLLKLVAKMKGFTSEAEVKLELNFLKSKYKDYLKIATEDKLGFIAWLQKHIEDLGVDVAGRLAQIDELLNKTKTSPVSSATLGKIVDPENFTGGEHTGTEMVTSTRGNNAGKQTKAFLRSPTSMVAFNDKGADPGSPEGEAFFKGKVSTNFVGANPTKITVEFEGNKPAARPAPAASSTASAPSSASPATVAATPEEVAINSKLDSLFETYKSQGKTDQEAETLALSSLSDAERQVLRDAYDRNRAATSSNDAEQAALEQVQNVDSTVASDTSMEELEDEDEYSAFDANVAPTVPSIALSTDAAKAELRRLIPNITEEQMAFVEKMVLDKMARKGEDLLGLFKNSKIFVALNEDGNVPLTILRHEAFHKIFNDYLSKEERDTLKKELDPNNLQSASEIDEHLANKFMVFKDSPSSFSEKVALIFNKVLGWLGFARNNELTLKQLFRDIENGRFTRVSDPSAVRTPVRRAFDKIRETFGNSMNYKASINLITEMIEHYRTEGLHLVEVYGKEELKQRIRKFISTDLPTHNLKKLAIMRRDGLAVDLQGRSIADLENEVALTKLIFEKDDTFDRLWKSIYRSTTKDKDTVNFQEQEEAEDREDFTYNTEEVYSNFIDDLAKDQAEKDTEGTATDAVKDAISFVKHRGKIVEPGKAYAVALRAMSGKNGEIAELGARGTQTAAVVEHLNNLQFEAERPSMEAKIVVKDPVTKKKTVLEAEVALTDNIMFIREDIIAISTDPSINLNKYDNYTLLNKIGNNGNLGNGKLLLYQRQKGQSTSNFIKGVTGIVRTTPGLQYELYEGQGEQQLNSADRILENNIRKLQERGGTEEEVEVLRKEGEETKQIILSNRDQRIAKNKAEHDKAFTPEQQNRVEELRLKALFRKYQYQREWAAVSSHFSSHLEATYAVGERAWNEGNREFKYQQRFLVGKEASVRNSIKTAIRENMEPNIKAIMALYSMEEDEKAGYDNRENPFVRVPIVDEAGNQLTREVISKKPNTRKEEWITKTEPATRLVRKDGTATKNELLREIDAILELLGLDPYTVVDENGAIVERELLTNRKRTASKRGLQDLINTIASNVYEQTKKDYAINTKKIGEDADEETTTKTTVQDILNDSVGYITDAVDELVGDDLDESMKMRGADGKNRYPFQLGSQAMENIQNRVFTSDANIFKENRRDKGITKAIKDKVDELRKTLKGEAFWEARRRIERGLDYGIAYGAVHDVGLNEVYRILHHDGFGWKDADYATSYGDENETDWISRTFGLGFMGYDIVTGSANSHNFGDRKPKYVQFFYTKSNAVTQKGAVVNILTYEQQKLGLIAMLDHHLSAPDIVSVKGYDKYEAVNNDVVIKALDEVVPAIGKLRAGYKAEENPELKNKLGIKLAEAYKGITEQQKKDIAEASLKGLEKEAEWLVKFMKTNKVVVGDNLATFKNRITSLKDHTSKSDPTRSGGSDYMGPDWHKAPFDNKELEGDATSRLEYDEEGYITNPDTQLMPYAIAFINNNYINGYFLNDWAAGNMNFFGSGLLMGKRLSTVDGSGKKPLIGKYYTNRFAKVGVISDPRFTFAEISKALEGTAIGEALKKKASELADGAAFITPQRKENILAGVGEDFRGSTVFKPIISGSHERLVKYRDGSTGMEMVPLAIKDSEVELTDELCAAHPLLNDLRNAMWRDEVDIAVMGSGVKKGTPNSEDLANGEDISNLSFNEWNSFDINNDKYRLQLNPMSKPFKDKGTSVPTQLLYIINTMNNELGLNNDMVQEIYDSLGELYKIGLGRFKKNMLNADGVVKPAALANTMNPEANERVIALLENNIDINLPMLADKAYSQIANTLTKFTTRIKFPGGKLVQQTSYGVKKAFIDENGNESTRNLQVIEEDGRLYAEVLLPMEYKDKIAAGSFVLPDGMAYRIPSTGYNSIIGFKVAGYTADKVTGTNTIIGPAELITQMGSDFDVDSLFVIVRVNDKEGNPIGYIKNEETGQYEWNPVSYAAQRGIVWKASRAHVSTGIDGVDVQGSVEGLGYSDIQESGEPLAAIETSSTAEGTKLVENLHINTIVNNLLHLISDIANKPRVTDVVSTKAVEDALEALGIRADSRVDLSSARDNMKFHQSNHQGLKLTGAFADISKSLAYMTRAGKEGGHPESRVAITVGDTTYDKFTQQGTDTAGDLWQVLSSLVNAAVDNVKEQLLYKMNASNVTARMYGAALSLGMPLKDAMTILAQPVMRKASAQGKLELAQEYMYNRLREVDPDLFKPMSNSEITRYFKEEFSGVTINLGDLAKTLTKDVEDLDYTEVIEQLLVLKEVSKLEKIGNDISKFAKMVNVIQGFPANYEELQVIKELFDDVLIEQEDGSYKTKDSFSFDISNLFEAQPNVKQAYYNMEELMWIIQDNIFIHNPIVDSFVDTLLNEFPIKIDYKLNRTAVKRELMGYMAATMYSGSLEQEEPFVYEDDEKIERIVRGKEAWNQRFIERYEEEFKKKKDENAFLGPISVTVNRGLKRLSFSINSNIKAVEELELAEGFEQIEDPRFRDDLVKYAVLNHGMGFGYRNYSAYIAPSGLTKVSEFMKELRSRIETLEDTKVQDEEGNEYVVKTNPYLSSIYQHFAFSMMGAKAKHLKSFPKGEKSIAQLNDRNDPESGKQIITLPNPANGPGATKEVEVHSGVDEFGIYFDKEFVNKFNTDFTQQDEDAKADDSNDVIQGVSTEEQGEDGTQDVTDDNNAVPAADKVTAKPKRVEKLSKFPLFVKQSVKRGVVYFYRITEPNSPLVRYVKMGYSSFGGYEVPAIMNWKAEDYFGKKDVLPLMVQNRDALSHEVYTSGEIAEGTKVLLYEFSNRGTRDTAIKTVVTNVSTSGANRYTIEVEERGTVNEETQLSKVISPEQQKLSRKVSSAITALVSRFGIPVEIVRPDQMPFGHSDAKGMYVNGRVYLNAALMTNDTAFHEVAHPIISAIQKQNPTWYGELVQELGKSQLGIETLNKVKIAYPELSEQEQIEEALVTLIGLTASGRMEKVSTLAKLVNRLMRAIGDRVKSALQGLGIKGLETLGRNAYSNLSIMDLARVLNGEQEALNPELSKLDTDPTKISLQRTEIEDIEMRLFKDGRLIISCK